MTVHKYTAKPNRGHKSAARLQRAIEQSPLQRVAPLQQLEKKEKKKLNMDPLPYIPVAAAPVLISRHEQHCEVFCILRLLLFACERSSCRVVVGFARITFPPRRLSIDPSIHPSSQPKMHRFFVALLRKQGPIILPPPPPSQSLVLR